MSTHKFAWNLFLMFCALGSVLLAYTAQSRGTRGILIKTSATKSLFLIISPHRPGECSKAVDAVAAMDNSNLGQWSWGCASGDHTGYLMVEADNQQTALLMVPESLRSRARAIKVDRYKPEQLSSMGGLR